MSQGSDAAHRLSDFVGTAEAAITAVVLGLGKAIEGRLERVRENGERLVHFHVAWSGVEVWIGDVEGGNDIEVRSRAGKRHPVFESASDLPLEKLIERACEEVRREIDREGKRYGKR